MPSIAMTVPYLRTSMLYIPRRDLVLASSDSLYLRVTIVDSDNPCAQGIEISGGIGGPGAVFSVWDDGQGWYGLDYGTLLPHCGQPLLSLAGVHPASGAVGAFDFTFPSGRMTSWPRRCGWCVQLTYDDTSAEVLVAGKLHVRKLGAAFRFDPPALATSAGVLVHTSTGEQVYA